MKRNECSVEKLISLGYRAKHYFDGSWHTRPRTTDCNARDEKDVFDVFATAVRQGKNISHQRNYYTYTVNIYVEDLDFTNTPGRDHFFLSRPMTEAERFEADLITGRGKDWEPQTLPE